jgi:hypothetical protein
MPTLVEIGHLQIRIHARDHLPPHFHISTPDGEAMMLISDLSLCRGRLRQSELKLVLAWARANREFLQDAWFRYNG